MQFSIMLVRALLEIAASAGVTPARLLDTARFAPGRLKSSEALASHEEFECLCESAIELTGLPMLGLRAGELANATTYGLSAHLVGHADTLRQAIDSLLEFQPLLVEPPALRVIDGRDTVTLRCEIGAGSPTTRRFLSELTMTGALRLVRYFCPSSSVRRVSFDYAAPPYHAEYARVFGGAERFGSSTGIVIDRELLAFSPLHSDPELYAASRAQAEKRISRRRGNVSYAQRVRDLLLHGVSGRRDMETIARACGLSIRSLRRRLTAEGASYNVVADDVLATLARQLLVEQQRSVQEVAHALGFSDPSAFNRAFKRWTGTTPSLFARSSANDPRVSRRSVSCPPE